MAAGGDAASINATAVDRLLRHDLVDHLHDQCDVAATALGCGVIPFPAAIGVRAQRLFGIQHRVVPGGGQPVHACAGREIVGILFASVQHDDQWNRRSGSRSQGWQEQPVVHATHRQAGGDAR